MPSLYCSQNELKSFFVLLLLIATCSFLHWSNKFDDRPEIIDNKLRLAPLAVSLYYFGYNVIVNLMLVEQTLLPNDNLSLFEYNSDKWMIFPLLIDKILMIYNDMSILYLLDKALLKWKISHNTAKHYEILEFITQSDVSTSKWFA